MKRSLVKKWAALSLALLLTCAMTPPAWAAPGDPEGELLISSTRDFLDFARRCSLDAWSQGMTVRLEADLDLLGREFTPIPTFGGVFLGQGHTISGLRITAAGSRMGLFRCIQPGGAVQDLTVSGVVAPGGSGDSVGGIAGVNAGTIHNCRYRGLVSGKSAVGGIAGLNEENAGITGCSVSGTVSGEEASGGVAGRNLGVLLKCSSSAGVNTAAPEQRSSVEALSGELLDSVRPDSDDAGTSRLNGHSDTGGIAGFSSGAVQDCTNTGTVGYPHVGYNVGGIAGRQTGYLAGCGNRGTIYGRKDVGGITGQAEPHITLVPGRTDLDRLRTELDTLDRLVDQALSEAGRDGSAVSARLRDMGGIMDRARDSAKALSDGAASFADGNIDELNTLSASITAALDGLTPAMDALSDAAGRLEDIMAPLEDALDILGGAADLGEDAVSAAGEAAGGLKRAGEAMSSAVQDFRHSLETLQNAVIIRDQEAVSAAAADLSSALTRLGSALRQAGEALDALREALGQILPSGAGSALKSMAAALAEMGAALRQAGEAAAAIRDNVSLDWSQVRAALREAGDGFQRLHDAVKRLTASTGDLQSALRGLGTVSGQLGSALRELTKAADSAVPAGQALERAFGLLRDVTEDLSEEEPVRLTSLGEKTQAASEDLFGSLSDLSTEMKALHSAVSGAGDTMEANLRAVNRQFTAVMNVLLDIAAGIQDGAGSEAADLVEDTSDEDIAATRLGKVTACRNTGAVEGDRNVGGIAGAVSIELGLDPEDDLTLALGRTYETKAVLESCVNQGPVTAKKDCAGGNVGRMDLGSAVSCENYGPVESTSGSYAGGVAGLTEGTVRECYAKCTLSGTDDVGGIAGWADSLRDCFAIATIQKGTERVGAIAGSGEHSGFLRNYFVDTGYAAVDGISYAGQAEPIAFEDLRSRPGIPEAFTSFQLTLIDNGSTVARIPFSYGEDLSRLTLPELPSNEDCYGVWPPFSTTGLDSDITLEAVYIPWVTLVPSKAQDGPLALALAGGRFREETVLEVRESTETPPVTGEADVWDLTLSGPDLNVSGPVPVRLLNRHGENAAVWQCRDGVWVQMDAGKNGQYLLLEMDGPSGTFCVASTSGSGTWLPAAAAAAFILLLAAAKALHTRRQKKTPPCKTV